MPTFLSQEQIYRMLQRELPEGTYPDGPASAFYSTADSDATAKVIAGVYDNLSRIYENMWPETADEQLSDWEIKVFGRNLSASLTLAQRRALVIAKIRSQSGISKADISALVSTIIGSDKIFEIIEWGFGDGAWVLGESQLGINTFLAGPSRFRATGPDLCSADPADYGMTSDDWLDMRSDAYTYEVRIYTATLSEEVYLALDVALSDSEPARSQHVISDGLDLDEIINPDEFEFSMGLEEGGQLGLEEGGVLEVTP